MCGENNRMTEVDVKNLAISYIEQEIITSMDLDELTLEELSNVFLPLKYMSPEQRDEIINKKPVFLYEYKSKAIGPKQFNSFKYLEEEWANTFKAAVRDYLEQKYKALYKL